MKRVCAGTPCREQAAYPPLEKHMQALTPANTERLSSAGASVRELTPAETDLVSGGIVPIVVFAVAAAAAAMQGSCSGGDESSTEQSDD